MATNMNSSVRTSKLLSIAFSAGTESHVKVNQRMLIDKMLARYSSDCAVFRELIQNADDAQATLFHLEIICNASNLHHSEYTSETRDRVEHRFKLPWKKNKTRSITDGADLFNASSVHTHLSDVDFHNSKITEMRASNNGHPFTKTDWERVAAIADGNIDVNSVGQFGVGFFSVFSYSDHPIITSGKEYMTFAWDDNNTLKTYHLELPVEERSQLTSIILEMRSPFVIQSSSNLDGQHGMESSTDKKIKSNKKPVSLDKIVPKIDIAQLKAFFTRVLSFTRYINELMISINGVNIFQVKKTKSIVPLLKKSIHFKQASINNIFQLRSFVHSEQTISIVNGPSVTLSHVTVEAKVTINEDLHQMIQHIIKKRLPSNVSIQLLYAPDTLAKELQQLHTSDHISQIDASTRILYSLVPLKFDNGNITTAGHVFFGFETHQTTGVGMHIHSHLIPTVERESLDLQDPHISMWNNELLVTTGQIIRFIYDQIMPNTIKTITNSCHIAPIFAPYSFQTTTPNQHIGNAIFRGFFTSDKYLQVPVRQSPLDSHLSLIVSTEAFLAYSRHLHAFLKLPLVPLELVQSGLVIALKQDRFINEVNEEIILSYLQSYILTSNELVMLLTWLRMEHRHDDSYRNKVLMRVTFRENLDSTVIPFHRIKHYDTFNISSLLPLPSKVIPNSIAKHFSHEDLQFNFFLTTCTIRDLLEFYLSEDQQKLFQNAQTSECLFRFISKYSWQLIDAYWVKIRTILSNIKCISTNHGMKIPSESYLPSSLLTNDLPMVTFKLSNSNTDVDNRGIMEDDCISVSFLKQIGCRIFNVQSLVKAQQGTTSIAFNTPSSFSIQALVLQLMEERTNMNEADFKSIKESKFLTGTTLGSTIGIHGHYAPHELHFPSVASQLNWLSLPIIDWLDINPRSSEYAFLKEIGVREVPHLNELLDRIAQKHNDQERKTKNNYKIPIELHFFAQHFQQHYCNKENMNQLERAFLPSVWPSKTIKLNSETIESDVVLLEPSKTFTDLSPICPRLLPEVVTLFCEYFDIKWLGVKEKPTLTEAFDIVMEKKPELLQTISSASIVFAYFNELDGQNHTIVERLLKTPFIPFNDNGLLVTPTQIFIRSHSDNTKAISSELKENDEIDTRGLIDFVDFGSKANSFLFRIGVLQYPSASVLAEILIERQAAYFSESMNEKQTLKKKLNGYIYCLKQLSSSNNISNELLMGPIRERLQREPWCLGYQIVIRDNGKEEKMFKVTIPKEVYLNDDHPSAVDLKPLCSPDEPLLTNLYEKFGSIWLSDCVQRVFVHTGHTNPSDRARDLCELILHRFDMLFVNNRGVRMATIDEEKAELLSRTLSVYETDDIQCRLKFEGKTTIVKSDFRNSCALELENDRVTLYLLRDHAEIDYFEIARALAQLVFKNPKETMFYAINDKLASPLEVLKRRGIPVDRLLKHVEPQQPMQMMQQKSPEKESSIPEYEYQKENEQKQQQTSNHALIKNHRKRTSSKENKKEQNKSNSNASKIERLTKVIDSVKDFRQSSNNHDNVIRRMIHKSRPYTRKELTEDQCERIEHIHSCTMEPGMHLVRSEHTFYSIPLYIDTGVTITEKLMDYAEELALLVKNLATEVFKIPIETIYLFRDINTAKIAFNNQGAIFYNLRYYEQVYAEELHQSTVPANLKQKLVDFYFLTTCHELTHNVFPGHDLSFISHMQMVTIEYMPAKDIFIQQLSLNSILKKNRTRF